MSRNIRISASILLLAALMSQNTFAATVDIYNPISINREVTFIAGEADGSTEGEGVTEGTSNNENTAASLNSQISRELAQRRQQLVENSDMVGDLLIRGDTYAVNTYTYYVDTYELRNYVMEATGYETVTGLLPVQRYQRDVDFEAITERYTEMVAIGMEILEELQEIENLDEIEWEDLPDPERLQRFILDWQWISEQVEVPTIQQGEPRNGEPQGSALHNPLADFQEAIGDIVERLGNGNLRGGRGLPGDGDDSENANGGGDGSDGGTAERMRLLWQILTEDMELEELEDLTPPELEPLEVLTFTGEIEEIEMKLERVLGYILHDEYTLWNEDILAEWQIPIVDIINGEIRVNEGAVGLEYERMDLIPGGIIDTRTLESRFRLLYVYLNHIFTEDQVNTRVVSEYRITGEVQDQIVERVPTDTWVWTVDDAAGNPVTSPIYTQGRYLRFIFNSPGTYRIRANQLMNVVRADVVSYDRNEYWVLNNGDIFDGMVIYRDHRTGMTYRTNVSQELEEVPVSDIQQVVTPDMVGFAYIAGPGTGLVGVRPEFNTQRYK